MTETVHESVVVAPPAARGARWVGLAFVGAVGMGMFVMRMMGRSDLLDNDQQRPASYMMDLLKNGHWLCQRDWLDAICSKPPLYQWLMAAGSVFVGAGRLGLYLPVGLATTGIAVLIAWAGRKWFTWQAGVLGGAGYLLSPLIAHQMGLARPDAVFALAVTAGAVAAFAAWEKGKGWIWFYLAVAAAVLTKGPLGMALAAGGLLAAVWEKRQGYKAGLGRGHWMGVAALLGLTGGWFGLAVLEMGRPVVDKMIFEEFFGQIAQSNYGAPPLVGFYKPWLSFLATFAPWSVLAIAGIVQVVSRPAKGDSERRFERFLVCWFLAGMVIFSIAPHRRHDHLCPLVPAAALLGGRALQGLMGRLKETTWWAGVTVGAVLFGVGFGVYYVGIKPSEPMLISTMKVEELAGRIRREAGAEFPLTQTDGPYAIQFYLGTMHPVIPMDRAARMLAGKAAAYVVAGKAEVFGPLVKGAGVRRLEEIAGEDQTLTLWSNRAKVAWEEEMAMGVGPLRLEMKKARVTKIRGMEFEFTATAKGASVELVNESSQRCEAIAGFAGGWAQIVTLRAGERVVIEAGR